VSPRLGKEAVVSEYNRVVQVDSTARPMEVEDDLEVIRERSTRLHRGEVVPRTQNNVVGAFSIFAGKASERLLYLTSGYAWPDRVCYAKLINVGVLREWLGGVTESSQGAGRRDMSIPPFSTATMTSQLIHPREVYRRPEMPTRLLHRRLPQCSEIPRC
jgi:hypothetical protein